MLHCAAEEITLFASPGPDWRLAVTLASYATTKHPPEKQKPIRPQFPALAPQCLSAGTWA